MTRRSTATKCDLCGTRHGPLSDMEPDDEQYVHHQRAKARRSQQRELASIREALGSRKPDPDLDAWLAQHEPAS